jgi:PAS domain S-box-containing protein
MSSRDGAARLSSSEFLTGGGEMAALMRVHDWTKTPLGLPGTWPQPLQTLVSVMLGSKQPMFIVWGAERTLLYNDAYAEILVSRHPEALGRDFLAVWSEISADLAPIVDQAYAGVPVHMDDIALVMERRGHPEEAHFAFSYTPVRGADGAVAGFFCPCAEITGQVLAERRRAFWLALEERLHAVADPSEIVAIASEALGRHLRVGQIVYAEVEADGDFVTVEREWNDGTIASNTGRHRLDNFGPAFIAELRRGETAVVGDVGIDPRTASPQALAAFARASVGGLVNVPLIKAERLVAILGVHNASPRAWSAEDVALAQEVADRTWAAVERARAEARLRETSRRLNAVLANASVSIFLMDSDHRCLYMNQAAEALTGYVLGETQGHHLHDVIHHTRPDGSPYPSHECPIDGVSPGTDRQQGEEVFVHKSGRFLPVAFAASSIRDETGEPVGTIVEVQDISERKAAEAELRESEARLERALEAGELGAWELNLETLAAWRSPQHDRIFGYQTMLPEWTYDIFIDHVLPEDRGRVESAFQAAIAGAGRWDFECRIRRADGERRWIWAQGRVEAGGGGQPERIKGTVRDVTDRHAVEERLRELNEGLEQRVAERTAERNRVWEMSRDLFAIMGFDGHLKVINPAWETTLGRDTKTLLALSFREQVHPDDHQAVQAVMEQLLRGETVERFEDRLRHADGSWLWISWTLVPEGEVFYAVGRDVTPEKEAAAELEQAQEALRQSQKMEAMGQLTGGVAHDFNNLLTPIVGSLDMLQRKGLGGEREQRLIAGAVQSADRAKTLVQRLLAFARRQPLQPTAVDVARLVTGMADLVASTSGPQIRVVVETAENLPSAKADPNQLEMALLNLGVNARDAMPDGGTLRITARHGRSNARQGHRAVLLDQGHRQGHGPGPVNGARARLATGRSAHDREPPGRRDQCRALAAAERCPGPAARAGAAGATHACRQGDRPPGRRRRAGSHEHRRHAERPWLCGRRSGLGRGGDPAASGRGEAGSCRHRPSDARDERHRARAGHPIGASRRRDPDRVGICRGGRHRPGPAAPDQAVPTRRPRRQAARDNGASLENGTSDREGGRNGSYRVPLRDLPKS